MDLVKILEAISDDEDVVRMVLDEWFLSRDHGQDAVVRNRLYTIALRGPTGATLKVARMAGSDEAAVQSGEKWANDHPKFKEFGPWTGKVLDVQD